MARNKKPETVVDERVDILRAELLYHERRGITSYYLRAENDEDRYIGTVRFYKNKRQWDASLGRWAVLPFGKFVVTDVRGGVRETFAVRELAEGYLIACFLKEFDEMESVMREAGLAP